LAQQYETILRECGHGRFQWTLYFVLGLALMADGVEVFVVGFVLPSAEKDMCLSDSNKGMLGKKSPRPCCGEPDCPTSFASCI
jgi:VNT family MFS transporter (synaptic vesicle glycoprotein 2)